MNIHRRKVNHKLKLQKIQNLKAHTGSSFNRHIPMKTKTYTCEYCKMLDTPQGGLEGSVITYNKLRRGGGGGGRL